MTLRVIMKNEIKQFQPAAEMLYANSGLIKDKSLTLISRLKEHLKVIKQNEQLPFNKGDIVYVPDTHGDFVHMIITLYKHGVLDLDLNLKKEFKYVFLGDIYDRAPDSDVIDFWLNYQLENGIEIYKLIGNHEMAFLERNEEGYPIIFPSQDSIRDASNDFKITENLLKNISDGNILAAYCNGQTLYVHSYIMNDDYAELGLEKNSDVLDFAMTLNKRFNEHGKESYDVYWECKKKGQYNWKEIIKSFNGENIGGLYLVESLHQIAIRMKDFVLNSDLIEDVFATDEDLISFLVGRIRLFSPKKN